MTKQHFEILSASLVKELIDGEFQKIDVNFESQIIYEGHVPNVGYVVLEGEAYLCKRNRALQKLQVHSLVGVEELFNHSPFKWSLKVTPGTKLLILDRSTVQEILSNQDHHAHHIIKDLVAV